MRAQQLADACGVTYRQLDYWCRTGVLGDDLAVSGSGRHRHFTDDHVRAVVVLGNLARIIVSFGGRGLPTLLAAHVVETIQGTTAAWLTIAGTHVTAAEQPYLVDGALIMRIPELLEAHRLREEAA